MTLRLLVDAERVVSGWLRADTEIAEAAEAAGIDTVRVVTEWGRNQQWPACRITRVGGSLITRDTYKGERVLMQFDIAGGPKVQANAFAEIIRAALVQRFNGPLTVDGTEFVAHMVDAGGFRQLATRRPGQDSSVTDDTSPASKPGVSFDAVIVLTPATAGS